MKGLFNRFLWVFLMLAFIGSVGGGYHYFHNHRMDAEKIVERALRNGAKLKSYFSSLEIISEGEETGQRYFVQTWFLAPARYRVEIFTSYIGEELPTQVFISDGEKRWIYSPEIDDYYLLNPLSKGDLSTSPFLLTSFLQELHQARGVELMGMEKHEQKSYYVLKIIPQAASRTHSWEKVWLEKRSLLPVKIKMYDEQDHLFQTITFNKIDLNPDLTDEIFRIVPASEKTLYYSK